MVVIVLFLYSLMSTIKKTKQSEWQNYAISSLNVTNNYLLTWIFSSTAALGKNHYVYYKENTGSVNAQYLVVLEEILFFNYTHRYTLAHVLYIYRVIKEQLSCFFFIWCLLLDPVFEIKHSYCGTVAHFILYCP